MNRRRKPSARERLAASVREQRLALGLSQERFAEACGLHRTYIGQVERGERNVSIDNIERMATALGVDVTEMFSAANER
jgi:transcriptional regulator with XRE-family HTH domain